MTSKADVLLVTVTDVETDAVQEVLREQLGRDFQQIFGDVVVRDLGAIGGARTALVRSEMGTTSALQKVTTAITALQPLAVIMVGIAFGMRPEAQQIGDVLVAKQLLLYDLQRVGSNAEGGAQIRLRGDRVTSAERLLERMRAAREIWRQAQVHVGLLLSGDKLIDNLAYRDQLRQLEPEAIGGEMEGGGLYLAAQQGKVDWILVKAICDWADGQKGLHQAEHQRLAARNAASFVLHVIQQGGWAPSTAAPPPAAPPAGGPADLPRLRQLLAERLSAEELRTACFDLGIDPDDLGGEGKAARARELIAYLSRRGALDRLWGWLRANRPDIT